uniref:Uncharacterized protein n=1 Tax=Oryza nivara TaxID=4536 RepID=A0A0E0IR08_ORYNI
MSASSVPPVAPPPSSASSLKLMAAARNGRQVSRRGSGAGGRAPGASTGALRHGHLDVEG